MNEREQVQEIIDSLPDCKISALLFFLQGMQFSDEIENNSHGTKWKKFQNSEETFRLMREVHPELNISRPYHSISELMEDLESE